MTRMSEGDRDAADADDHGPEAGVDLAGCRFATQADLRGQEQIAGGDGQCDDPEGDLQGPRGGFAPMPVLFDGV